MRSQLYKFSVITALISGVLCCTNTVKAQINPLSTQYYQNQYLFNPAMAGLNEGLIINANYSKLGLSVDGIQNTQAISAEYQLQKVGLGVNVINQFSGIFRNTRAVVTYAYHLPVGASGQKLSFGLSGGFVNQHAEVSNIIGDQSDLSVARYNSNKQTYIDGDLGIAYTASKFTLQGSLPNLKSLFKDDITYAEQEKFFTSASYKFLDPADVSVEPKIVYRSVRGFSQIVDGAVNVAFNNNAFSLQGIYHSSNSATFGFGLNMAEYSILGYYTTNTTTLNAYSNGNYEISLRVNLSKIKK